MKAAFEIDRAIALLRQAVQPFPQAAMFELAERGYRSPFEQLVGCILSIRTRDETSLPVAMQLLEVARTPAQMTHLSVDQIDRLIQESTYHETKAPQILAIAQQIVSTYGGELPCDFDTLISFAGVGPKCANLVLGIACQQPCISVDIHVHRVTNRWGYVQTRSPEKTLAALQTQLPQPYWIEINRLLVPFGKHICTGELPKCSQCPLLEMCQQVGVTHAR